MDKDLSVPLVLLLNQGAHFSHELEASEICDSMVHTSERDKEACYEMFSIMTEYTERDRCFIEWIRKYDSIDIWN